MMENVFKENNSREIVQYFKLKKIKSNLITK